MPLAMSATAALAGQIGASLNGRDCIDIGELPAWKDRAERLAAILDALSESDESRALQLLSAASISTSSPPND